MATFDELYAQYPFNRDNYLKFMALWLELEFAGVVTVEETDLLLAYNHDNYEKLIQDALTAGAEPPEAIIPVVEAEWTVDVLITPIDFSNNFTGFVESYGITITPPGLSFDTNTGILSGTPTSVGGGSPIVTAYGRTQNGTCSLDYTVLSA